MAIYHVGLGTLTQEVTEADLEALGVLLTTVRT